ncbi:protein BIG GRAIN 1-like E [Magnolia sinica]|uniref:protein BIG GRAIN 1-like E n=1 Tax=Magnolia sinica TaxID=86752 RepID=UPI00265A3908|nr:protein BIG GRAIN 1-like E [Magnolia sinica]
MKETHKLTPPYPPHLSSTMSTIGFEDPHKATKKVAHRRNDSGELDVFEAARYFAGAFTGATSPPKSMREERLLWSGGRKSLDIPMQHNQHHSFSHRLEKHPKEKKSKQPRSPGAKLASFLNSLFSQTSSKKKSKSSSHSMRDEGESPNGRRKRRSSISHFRSISAMDSQYMYSSRSASGFRTPPPKVCGDVQPRSVTVYTSNESHDEKKDLGWDWLDQRFGFNDGFLEKNGTLFDEIPSKERNFKKVCGEVEDCGESDSSSDLFELQNYDLGVYSNGLPVYETTHVGPIKRGAPIASG